eukprot:scaffold10356_cov102-Skeletonema_marinoi.AAC.2
MDGWMDGWMEERLQHCCCGTEEEANVFRLCKAYPETVMSIYRCMRQSASGACPNLNGKEEGSK